MRAKTNQKLRPMAKQYAETLAREYGWESKEDYYDYIIESVQNGQRRQAKTLFNQMHNYDQEDFLINHIDTSTGIHKSTLNVCITELCNK